MAKMVDWDTWRKSPQGEQCLEAMTLDAINQTSAWALWMASLPGSGQAALQWWQTRQWKRDDA